MSDDLSHATPGTEPDPDAIATGSEFAAALTDLRHRAGLSIRSIARSTGIPSATLGGYFSGRHLPPATQPQVLEDLLAELGVHRPDDVQRWRSALARARRATPGRPGSSPTRRPGAGSGGASPYRGLEPYTEGDAALFVGREHVVDALVEEVDRAGAVGGSRVVLVVGASGSGKSSVLRAGLVPRLTNRDHLPWRAVVMVPGTAPSGALAAAREQLAGATRALLVVDQAEEMFSPEVSPEARHEFLQELVELTSATDPDGAVTVVVGGLRADFYGQAASDPDLLPVLRDHQVVLGAMTIADLRRAVVEPAASLGVQVDPALVDLVVRDLTPRGVSTQGYEAGALPLVSHALLASWEHHTGDRLAVADYIASGGIAGAVQQTAEGVVARLDDAGRAAAQWLFGQLVSVDDEGLMARRRVSHDDLRHPDPQTDLALDDVIEAFVAGRLLTAGDGTLQISHEALLQAWPRLHEWVLTDLDAARMQRRISEAAAVWRERDRDPAALLRGGPLSDAEALAARPITSHRVLSAPELEFVSASTAETQRTRSLEQRRTSRLRALLATMTALAVLAAALAGVALWAGGQARHEQAVAAQARDDALSRQLAIVADDLRAQDPALAAQLALAAVRTSPTVQARSSLLDSTAVPTPSRFAGPAGEMNAVARADGSLLAVSGKDSVTRLWQRAGQPATTDTAPAAGGAETLGDYVRIGDLPAVGKGGSVYASAFSPDGSWLALGTATGAVVLWDVSDPMAPRQGPLLVAEGPQVHAVAFSSSGRQLAAGTSEPAVLRWSLPPTGDPRPLPSITTGFDGMLQSVAYRPDGDILATGSADGMIRLWSSPNGRATLVGSAQVGPSTDFVLAVAFSPDGSLLASGEKGRVARIWDVRDPGAPVQQGEPLGGFTSWVNTIAFAPDGRSVVAGSSDGTIRFFDIPGGLPTLVLPAPAAVTGVQVVGSGSALLTSEIDGVARLWPLPGPTLVGFLDTVWCILQDREASELAVAAGTADGAVHVYDTTDPGGPRAVATLTPPAAAGAADGAAGMSADGRWIAAGTGTGSVAVWERTGPGRYREAGTVTLSDKLVGTVDIEGDPSVLAAVSDDGSVDLWTLVPGSAPEPLAQLDLPSLPLGLAFSPGAGSIAVPAADGSVYRWRLPAPGGSGAPEQLPTLTGFDNYVYAVAFDPSGRYLAAGSADRTIRIWDVSEPGAAVPVGAPIRGPANTVYQLNWRPDGAALAAASKEGRVWIWDMTDMTNPQVSATLNAAGTPLYDVMFTPDGTTLRASGAGRAVHTWHVDVDEVASQVCQRTGTAMSQAEWEQVAPGAPYTPPCPVPAGS